MTTEEFQSIVISELKEIKADIGEIKTDIGEMKAHINSLKEGQKSLGEGQKTLEKKVNIIYGQTGFLTEFREETKGEIKSIKKTLRRTEVSTADNWSDIAKIKSIL